MIDYRSKTYMSTLEEENEMLKQRWERLKTLAVTSNLKGLVEKMEELEEERKKNIKK